ncbi:Acetylornithine aminotransferase [Actinidia chinensis var. chinensis]|uniref:Acetylornithine aminotransferase n=1 Tax=Actinidia chinensis var. chinensis TaxID=1590841 RepID=A0A2R6RNA6_ACTCC|nr:Acetylornithine aminotransferase [Actinidia chinensis var. chinensis]
MRMEMMTIAGNALGGVAVASAGGRCSFSFPPQFTHPHHSYSLFAHRRPQFVYQKNHKTKRFSNPLTVAAADSSGGGPAAKAGPPPPSLTSDETTVAFVGEESVPLEGVIQFEKPNSSSLINKWGRVALLAGGDVLALLIFSAIGRFSHGFSVFDTETLRTADPFIAGWFLSAYFLGGFGEDGRGMNGLSKAVIAAAKSWSLGIPIGLVIRTTTVGHIPPPNFIIVTMGSTALLLVGWRALLFSIFPNDDKSKKNDMYRRGSPFELFELLASLVRRW